jgi:hypothetical protein
VPNTIRDYLSDSHRHSMQLFARLSGRVERQFKTGELPAEEYENLSANHTSFVIACVQSSVAFLESSIGEIYTDAKDRAGHYIDSDTMFLPPVSPVEMKINAEYREATRERREATCLKQEWISGLSDYYTSRKYRNAYTVDKYNVALKIMGKEQFDPADPHFQDVQLLIFLRNRLVHSEPQSAKILGVHGGGLATNHTWEQRLEATFPVNVLGAVSAPNKYFTYYLADWASKVSFKFAQTFFERIEIVPLWDDRERDEEVREIKKEIRLLWPE